MRIATVSADAIAPGDEVFIDVETVEHWLVVRRVEAEDGRVRMYFDGGALWSVPEYTAVEVRS